MAGTTVQVSSVLKHLRDHGVDLALGLLGTTAGAIAVAGPSMFAAPAVFVMAAAGAIMVCRNSGEEGSDQ